MPTIVQASAPLRSFSLVHMALASGDVRVTSRDSTISWGGHEWIGLGVLGAIDPIVAGGGDVAGLKFTLNGVLRETIIIARSTQVRQAPVKVYQGSLRAENDTVDWCELEWAGRIDGMHVGDSAGGASVTVTAEHLGMRLRKANPAHYTHAEQMKRWGDDSLKYVADQANRILVWPAAGWWRR